MINEQILRTSRFGYLTVYEGYRQNTGKVELTIYHKTPEDYYRFYPRAFDEWDAWSDKEVNWNNYLLGARQLRTDYDYDLTEWAEADTKERARILEALIQKMFDDDEVASYHVEKIETPKEWDEATDEQLWAREKELHTRRGELERELRDVHREYKLIWDYGDDKWQWGDRL